MEVLSTKPQPENFKIGAEYRWAKKMWLKHHGGYLWMTLAVAIIFGGLTQAGLAVRGVVRPPQRQA